MIRTWEKDRGAPAPLTPKLYFSHAVTPKPKRTLKRESWHMMHFLRNESTLPWMCSGDFNETLDDSEQIGGNDRQEGAWRVSRKQWSIAVSGT
jgi:hypothetical protein